MVSGARRQRSHARQRLIGMSMTDSHGERVGGVAGRQIAQSQQHFDHVLNLILGRVTAAGYRLLNLVG